MSRTFHHKFTIGAKCGVLFFVFLAFYLFWVKAFLIGLLLVFLAVFLMERSLHSEYIFSDEELTIYRGRFGGSKILPLSQIRSCRPQVANFGLSRFLVLEYGDNRYATVQPDQEASFVKCLRERMAALAKAHADEREPEMYED